MKLPKPCRYCAYFGHKTLLAGIVSIFVLCHAVIAAGASIKVTPAGNGSYLVQGNDLNGAAGIELTILYDSGLLATPSIGRGDLVAESVVTSNVGTEGAIRLTIISMKPFSGSGTLAEISFASRKGPGGLKSIVAAMIDRFGEPVAASGETVAEDSPYSPPASQTAVLPVSSGVADRLASANSDTPPLNVVSYKGVLERFRAYKGEKSPAILTALFRKGITDTFHQNPPVALSDGETVITITTELPDSRSPNFAFTNARLVSLHNDGARWQIRTLPNTGALEATLMILDDQVITEFPITIAPAVRNFSAAENDFALFIRDHGNNTDLNGDGRHDGVDDYIYTVNYLVRQEKDQKNGNVPAQ